MTGYATLCLMIKKKGKTKKLSSKEELKNLKEIEVYTKLRNSHNMVYLTATNGQHISAYTKKSLNTLITHDMMGDILINKYHFSH